MIELYLNGEKVFESDNIGYIAGEAHLEALVRAMLRATYQASVPGVRSDTMAKAVQLAKLEVSEVYELVTWEWERRDQIIATLREQLNARATELDRLRASVTIVSLVPCPVCGAAPMLQAPEEREGMFYYACESTQPTAHTVTGGPRETPEAAAQVWNAVWNSGVGRKL